MNDGTNVIYRGGPYNTSQTIYRHDLSLMTGMYALTILDSERDG